MGLYLVYIYGVLLLQLVSVEELWRDMLRSVTFDVVSIKLSDAGSIVFM